MQDEVNDRLADRVMPRARLFAATSFSKPVHKKKGKLFSYHTRRARLNWSSNQRQHHCLCTTTWRPELLPDQIRTNKEFVQKRAGKIRALRDVRPSCVSQRGGPRTRAENFLTQRDSITRRKHKITNIKLQPSKLLRTLCQEANVTPYSRRETPRITAWRLDTNSCRADTWVQPRCLSDGRREKFPKTASEDKSRKRYCPRHENCPKWPPTAGIDREVQRIDISRATNGRQEPSRPHRRR